MIYHIDNIMQRVILERLDEQNIKVDISKSFSYNGYRINLVDKTIDCLNPIKCEINKRGGI